MAARGYWWAAPRICQNSFRLRVFWRLHPPPARGVITSLLQAPPPSVFAPAVFLSSACRHQCICCQGAWEARGRNNISIQSSRQNLDSVKSSSTMTPHRLSRTVLRMSVWGLTHAVGFVVFPKSYVKVAPNWTFLKEKHSSLFFWLSFPSSLHF